MAVISFDVFWRDHGAVRGAQESGAAFDDAAKKHDQMTDAIKVGAIGAALAIGAFGKKAVEVASDTAESQSKVQVVFGKSADSVSNFAKTTATSMGISKAATLEAAGTFGNLLVSLKVPQAEAAKMSMKMITLAADMASFNNASPEETLEAIKSGLLGETEPLRKFGVSMDDATLRNQALKDGLVKTTKDALSPAIKAQAAYSVILAQTGTAQGDFARTSTGLANQQRTLTAQFSDLQGELGTKLLPVVVKVMGGLVKLVDILARNKDVVIPLATGTSVLAASIWLVNKAALGAAKSMTVWNVILNSTAVAGIKARASMMGLYSSLVIGAAGATALGAAWGAKTLNNMKASDVTVNQLTESMKKNSDQTKISTKEAELFGVRNGWVSNHLLGNGSGLDDSTKALEDFGHAAHNALDQGWTERANRFVNFSDTEKVFREETGRLDQSFAKLVQAGNLDQAQAQMKLYEDAAKKAGVPVSSLRRLFPEYTAAVKASEDATDKATKSIDHNTGALKTNHKQIKINAQALLGLRGSEVAYEQSVDDATKALKDNGKTLDIHTQKGRDNRSALDLVASSTLAWRDAAKKAGASQKEQTEITERARKQLQRIAGPDGFGMSKKAARQYSSEILGIPKKVSSQISLSLKNNIPKTLFGVKVGGYGQGLGVLRAAGGPVWGAGTETSDSIPAMLSHNEHVLTAREVRGLGGHRAVERMRADARGYAKGGSVLAPGLSSNMEKALVAVAGATSGRLAKILEQTAAKAIGYNPSLNGALNFARQQVGKPYIWGGVGPRGYDCSGAMSALLNVVQGLNPYHRRFATGSFPAAGFVPGPGSFMIGSRRGAPGHMAGTINGVNVESAGSVGFHMGKGARGARDRMFSGVYHLKGYRGGGAVSGDPAWDYLNPAGNDYLGGGLKDLLANLPAQVMDSGGVLPVGRSVVDNRTGSDEMLLRATGDVDFLKRRAKFVSRRSRGDKLRDAIKHGSPGSGGSGSTTAEWENVRLHPSDIRAIGAQVGLAVFYQLAKLNRLTGGADNVNGSGNLVSGGSSMFGLTQVVDRGITKSVPAASAGFDGQQIADTMVRALARSQLQVVMDGQVVGRLQGRQADILGRAN